MNLSKKIIGISLGVMLSALVVKHDYSLYQKIQKVEQSIEGTKNWFHGGSDGMHVQYEHRLNNLQEKKENLLNETYVLEYLY